MRTWLKNSWSWLKDKWEFVAAGVTVLVVFLLGRKSKNVDLTVAEQISDNKDEQIKVERELSAQEKLEIAQANKRYVDTRIALRRKYRAAKSELEKETTQRKLDLLETAKDNPAEIDRILLEEFNISKMDK